MSIPADSQYVDVTTEFFDAVKHMEPGKVQVISYFDMLEGARALEMGNAKLDTGLIELSEEELKFDVSEGQSLSTVVSIMNKLYILYMSWISGLSLLVTVLSCRYMLDFLQSYHETGSLLKARFVNLRLHNVASEPALDTHSQLVNVVLRAFVIGLAKTIGFSLSVAKNVLYDEEDLVTRSINGDFLDLISPQIVLLEIKKAEDWLQQREDLRHEKYYSIAANQLKLIETLVCLEDVLKLDVQLFATKETKRFFHKTDYINIIELLSDESYAEYPAAAFSRLVQLDCDNKHLPSNNTEISKADTYKGLTNLIISVDRMILHFTMMKNVSQLQSYLKRDISFDLANNANPLSRGIFQLFFIRDDRSIAGLNEDLGSITMRLMETTSVCGNNIMDPAQWNIQNSKNVELTKSECLNKVTELLNDLEAASLHKLGAYGNNRCRQRQTGNRNIVVLDSLHFKADTVEAELFSYGVGDKLSPFHHDQPAFGISSYIFLEKLDTMIDVALSGFEQDLYKHHEAPMMYWYVSNLCLQAHELITKRIIAINKGKLSIIQALPKKIKSTKAGQKKEALKEEYHRCKENLIPTLTDNILFHEKYSALSQTSLSYLTAGVSTAIHVMNAICKSGDKSSYLALDEMLYNLRMKPWSSIGVPALPTYKEYLQSTTPLANMANIPVSERKSKFLQVIRAASVQLDKALSCYEELCNNFENEPIIRQRTQIGDKCRDEIWHHALKKTCEVYKAQLDKLELKIDELCIINRVVGCSPYFPIYSVGQQT